jgi:hypothetical protein
MWDHHISGFHRELHMKFSIASATKGNQCILASMIMQDAGGLLRLQTWQLEDMRKQEDIKSVASTVMT